MPDTEATLHEVIAASDTPVLRSGMRPDYGHGAWNEVLPAAAADMGRLQDAPVTLDHDLRSAAQVGVVVKAHRRQGQIIAQIKFGSSAKAQEIARDVADRVRRAVSIGYSVGAWNRSGKGEVPTYTATRWTRL